MKTLKEKIEVMQAALDGGKLETCSLTYDGKWMPAHSPLFNWVQSDYRIKPEPREPRIFYSNEESSSLCKNRDAVAGLHKGKIIKLQEIIE